MVEPAPRLTLKSLKDELDAAHLQIAMLKENQKVLTQVLMQLIAQRAE